MMDQPFPRIPFGRDAQDIAMRAVLSDCRDEALREIAANPVSEAALQALRDTGAWLDVRDSNLVQHRTMNHYLTFQPTPRGIDDVQAGINLEEGWDENLELQLDHPERIQQIANEILQERQEDNPHG